ncbi:ATP-binding protein [Cognataquiflexum rubidum]|uniref:ATP-binding protein n=1 Tax=Cognataquiflexum rubidum TaxID=2922273 RepID=UPI001F13BDD3|nr:ATP-binding protein [Cognataquiflexum rubidum]MCH6233192.1 ATP-binding protein [Cognataquiflexum rubidum]
MLSQIILQETLASQKTDLQKKAFGLERFEVIELPVLSSHALIVSGIRRCGKSTFLLQMLSKRFPDAIYLNFEDPRLYGFDLSDFQKLDLLISEDKGKVLFFDEIQVIKGWEIFVRQKLDQGFQIIITGSNASLLSQELGTKLTGRHITKELFPFSFQEFCEFRNLPISIESVSQYVELGGFPEFLKSERQEILNQLLDDLLVRDIAQRYGVRDLKSLQQLTVYLITNVGKPVSGNQLKKVLEIGATSTVLEYFSYLEACWLFFFVPKFSYSQKKQLINPKKVYSIDTGMVAANSRSFSQDFGRRFENLVFLTLRRKHNEIYYFSEKKECDFVVFDRRGLLAVVQVCYKLSSENMDRELEGLWEAMSFFSLKKGYLVTLDQKDYFEKDDNRIEVVPFHEYEIP